LDRFNIQGEREEASRRRPEQDSALNLEKRERERRGRETTASNSSSVKQKIFFV
jgi:hypothetical protein